MPTVTLTTEQIRAIADLIERNTTAKGLENRPLRDALPILELALAAAKGTNRPVYFD